MSRKLGIAVCIVAPLCFAFGHWTAEQKLPRYENRELGFRIQGPDFSALGPHENGTVVTMLGPASGNFAPNLNVVVQPPQTPAEYRKLSLDQFKQLKLELRNEEKLSVGGREALLFEYGGPMLNRDMEFLALAIFDKEHIYLVTCTATKDQFPKLKAQFRASLESFAFIDSSGAKAKP